MRIAWCFPGQGSQFAGMGQDLAVRYSDAREVFERADRALGESLSALCFQGPIAELTLTRNTQPALLTTSMAALAALRQRLPHLPWPVAAAGHSLGEYSALVAASALTLEDALGIVRLRGEAMQAAVPAGAGGMAAIMGVSRETLGELCERAREGEVVAPANFNAPGQIVIAGHAGAVARASKLCVEAKGKAIALNVSAPFHCALMGPAARALELRLRAVTVSPLRFPVFANVDARSNDDASRIKDLLVRQVDHPVYWEDTVLALAAAGVTHVLEIGPGRVLANLIRRITKVIQVIPVGTAEDIEAAASLLG